MSTTKKPVLALDPVSAANFRRAYDAVATDQRVLQKRRQRVGVAMRERGATYREMAGTLGISRSYARDLVIDPVGAARRARSRVAEKRAAASKSSP